VEACERLTTLGIAVNLVTYLTRTMHIGNANAANDVTNFMGTSFMLCLLGGFVADTFLGRYLTIAIFTAVQATLRFWFISRTTLGDVGGRIVAFCIGMGLVIFLSGTRRHLELPSDPSLLFNLDDVQITDDARKLKQKLPHSKQFRFLDKAAIKNSEKSGEIFKVNKWYLSTSTDVEECHKQPPWTDTLGNLSTPVQHHLSVVLLGSIPSLTVPVYDRVVVPLARRCVDRDKEGPSLCTVHGLVDDPSKVVPLSVFWLVPQFFFVGSGEAFTYIGQLDFFLRECPKGMKTMSTGLFLSTLSLGFFVSSLLVTIVHKVTGDSEPWLADNLNKGKLYNFYWLLTILSFINIGLYLIASGWYVYREHRLAGEGIELEE
ncbi:NRT1/ PTR family 6.3-like protein, partial [Tanacetum coccineum]